MTFFDRLKVIFSFLIFFCNYEKLSEYLTIEILQIFATQKLHKDVCKKNCF